MFRSYASASTLIFGKHEGGAAEGVGLNDVGAGCEVGAMDIADDVGAGFDQVFVAAFERGAAEVGCRQIAVLEHSAHGPIEYEDAGGEGVCQGLLTLFWAVHGYPSIINGSRSGMLAWLWRRSQP